MPDFTPEAVRDTLTAAGYPERNPDRNFKETGYQVGDARGTLGQIFVEPLVKLADPPRMTEEERRDQALLMLGCKLALRVAGYTTTFASSTLIVITEGAGGQP